MKVYVQHEGGELMFPSFRDFQTMYRLKFVSPDDMVRRESSQRWTRAADLPEIRALMAQEAGPLKHLPLLLGGMVVAFVAVILFRMFFIVHFKL